MASNPNFQPLDNLPAHHPWSGLEDLKEVIVAMFSFDPSSRPDADTLLSKMQAITGDAGR